MRASRRWAAVAVTFTVLLGHAASAQAVQDPDPRLYAAIREEGLERSQVMGFVTGLADGIGGRLMGSPNMRRAYDWSQAELTRLGLANVHLEPIGTFGLNWRQTLAWVRMTAPDNTMYVAQAAPWSMATGGPVAGDVVAIGLDNDADLARLRGTLAGKIVLLGPLRATPPPGQLSTRYTDDEVLGGAAAQAVTAYYKTVGERRARQSQEALFKARRNAFLAAEGVKAVILPSRETDAGGGSGLLAIDGSELGGRPWIAAERPTFPIAYVAIEDFGRAWRLARSGVAVRLELDIRTEEAGQAEPGYNVVAELPGSDPALAPQIVLVGAHLDSWAAGTGAVDNGAGVAATLEAIRILKALSLKPRRTVRVVLYGGEEEGLLGSEAYARRHLGHIPRSTAPDQMALAVEGRRQKVGPLQRQPDYDDFSVAYNLDGGSGRIRAVFAGGNPKLAATYRQWIGPLKDLGVLAVYDGPHWPADQSTFTEIGLPGISFLQDPLDYDSRAHHTNLDTLERISPHDLSQAATVLAIFLINSANAAERPPRASQP